MSTIAHLSHCCVHIKRHNIYKLNMEMVLAVVTAGLFPNVALVEQGQRDHRVCGMCAWCARNLSSHPGGVR